MTTGWVNFGFTDHYSETRAQREIEQWGGATIKDLNLPAAIAVEGNTTLQETLDRMQKGGFDRIPIIDHDRKIIGIVTTSSLLNSITKGKALPNDPVTKSMYSSNTKKAYHQVTPETKLADLQRFFEKNSAAFVTEKKGDHMVLTSVVTKVDLLQYLIKNKK